MTSRHEVANIDPHELDDRLLGAQERLRQIDVAQAFAGALAAERTMARGPSEEMAYSLVLPPDGEIDASRIIIHILPHAQSSDADTGLHMHYRSLALQDVIGSGQHPVIAIPHMWRGKPAYDLGPGEMNLVSSGFFGPVAVRTEAALEDSGLVNDSQRFMVATWSLGASVGPIVTKRLGADRALYGDPVNWTDRTPKELRGDFKAGGLANLNIPIRDAGIPGLVEVQGAFHTNIPSVRQARGLLAFQRATKLPHNQANEQGMTHAGFTEDLEISLAEGSSALVVRGQTSRITGRGIFDVILDDFREITREEEKLHLATPDETRPGRFTRLEKNVGFAQIIGYGHGAGDNIIGGLGKAARMADELKPLR